MDIMDSQWHPSLKIVIFEVSGGDVEGDERPGTYFLTICDHQGNEILLPLLGGSQYDKIFPISK